MKLLVKDIIVLIFCSVIVIAASAMLVIDLTAKVDHRDSPKIGTITYKHNVAERKYSGQVLWDGVEKNETLYNFDSVRTTHNSSAIVKLSDGTTIELDENTLIKLNLTTKMASVDFSHGSIQARKIDKSRKEKSSLNITSEGTNVEIQEADVQISKEKETINLNVNEGNAKIAYKQDVNNVSSNQIASIDKKGAKVENSSIILTAPKSNQYYLTFSKERNVFFKWKQDFPEKNKKIKTYIKISRDRELRIPVLSKRVKKTKFKYQFSPGTYYWSIVTATGKEIEKSAVRKFIIIKDRIAAPVSPVNNKRIKYIYQNPLVTFKWVKSDYASSYQVEIAEDKKFENIVKTLHSEGNSISSEALTSGSYSWRVRYKYPFKNIKEQITKRAFKFRIVKSKKISPTELLYPEPNAIVSSILIKENKFLFNWVRNELMTEYIIEIAKDESFLKPIIRKKRTNYHILKKNLGTGTYYWRVNAKSHEDAIPVSSRIHKFIIVDKAEIKTVLPRKDSNISPFDNNGKINFSWHDPNLGTNYLLVLSMDRNFKDILYSGEHNEDYANLNFENLKMGEIFWRVFLLDRGKKKSAVSNISYAFLNGKLPSLKIKYPGNGITIYKEDRNRINFYWDTVDGATHYLLKILRITSTGDRIILNKKLKKNRYKLKNLRKLADSNYYWEVQALLYSDDNKVVKESKRERNYFTLKKERYFEKPELLSPTVIYRK